jgi:hypothetical protein
MQAPPVAPEVGADSSGPATPPAAAHSTGTSAATPSTGPAAPPAADLPDPVHPPSTRERTRTGAKRMSRGTAGTPAGAGDVAFRIRPWAEVYVDGRRLGITPLAPVRVPSGMRTFVLKNPELGTERRIRLEVPRDGTVELKADLFAR